MAPVRSKNQGYLKVKSRPLSKPSGRHCPLGLRPSDQSWRRQPCLQQPLLETAAPAQPDLAAVKQRQQGAWSSGDYAVVGTTLQIVGEQLCEALDLRPGSKVLDVAAGNGNVTLAAARRWCDVTSTDYVPALLERGRERATAERLKVEFREADAEALPFPDSELRRRRLDLRRDVHARPGQGRGRTAARVPQVRRQDRPGQLDAGGLHRRSCSRRSASICRRRPA